MKKLIVFFIFIINICKSQSSFFVGANGSANITTLLNKEDKSAPKGMLSKKNGVKASYGMQVGYKLKNGIRIGIAPNYLQYKINYSGSSDTANVKSFAAKVAFKYYQLPLVLSYHLLITSHISCFIGIGLSANYMSYYEEELHSKQSVVGLPNYIINSYFYTSGKSGYVESAELNNKWNVELSNAKYKHNSYSIIARMGVEYFITDKLGLDILLNYQRGLVDIENKGFGTERSTDKDNFTNTLSLNYWNETNYLRYYYRYPDKYNQRKATHTMALGLGLGINYHFNGGLLSKKQND